MMRQRSPPKRQTSSGFKSERLMVCVAVVVETDVLSLTVHAFSLRGATEVP